ncbi:MAG TPA: NADP-dependent malic enzyme [Geminicoccaceae bacterium]|nr:NADP-dependent malic enzyme [Geminicoccaceae bacterium]
MSDQLRDAALEYHRRPTPGKLAVAAIKPLANQRDLALAYSPGVAAASELIADDPLEAANLTARGNLVGVISNGTAVLGLGAIGPLAAKPVMEGKAVLFKKFAGIDAFDIEIDERDPDRLVEIIAALEPTFGAINLEDIKAPECFEVERKLRARMGIPVFHDDQHGTAIIVAAAILNGLELVGKTLDQIRLVACGAGAAALACLDLLVALGLRRERILVVDVEGVVYAGRTSLMDPYKARFAQETSARSLADAIVGADVFLGLSAPRVVSQAMVRSMADRPLILALANPVPEIDPAEARAARPDAIIATGRSDHPNQVNNVIGFPFIFRGALDVGATTINEEMKIACAQAIARLARTAVPETVAAAYGLSDLGFGPDSIIPKPFDPRLAVEVPVAVAQAAMASGVASRPIADFKAYRERLSQFVFRSGLTMKPIFERARERPKRVVFADGEEPRVLRAVQVLLEEGLARPILIGRPDVVRSRCEQLDLVLPLEQEVELCNPESDPRYNDYVAHYLARMGRGGVTPDAAREIVRTRPTVIGAIMLDRGEADALISGPTGRFEAHLRHIHQILGLRTDAHDSSTLHLLILERGSLFMADTYVSVDLPAEEVAETTLMAAETVRRFGILPKVALLSHSNFGSVDSESARKMRRALAIIRERAPDLEVDGEMHADAALSAAIRARILSDSRLSGEANLLIFPNLDAANIAFNLVKQVTNSVAVGPILIGPAKPAHIVTPSVTTRGIVNLSALAVVDAQSREV